MRKGDIFTYPKSVIPNRKHYVKEVYENIHDEWVVIFSFRDPYHGTWSSKAVYLEHLAIDINNGDIKLLGNEYDGIITTIKKHTLI